MRSDTTVIDYRKPFTDRERRVLGKKVVVRVRSRGKTASMSYAKAMVGGSDELRAGLDVDLFSGLFNSARSRGAADMGGSTVEVVTTELSKGDPGCVCDLPDLNSVCSDDLRLMPDAPRSGEFVPLCTLHELDYREAALDLICRPLTLTSATSILSRVYRHNSMARKMDRRLEGLLWHPTLLWELCGVSHPKKASGWKELWPALPGDDRYSLISSAIQSGGQP